MHEPDNSVEAPAPRRSRRIGCSALVLLFAVPAAAILIWLGIRFTGSPDISRNYTAEFNQRFQNMPQDEKAWPIYKQAFIELVQNPRPAPLALNWPSYPGFTNWDQAKDYLSKIAPALELARTAAPKPYFGKPLSDAPDPDIERAEAEAAGTPYTVIQPTENPAMVSVLLPELSHLRNLSQILTVDAYFAAEQGLTDRAVLDIQTILHNARHSSENKTIIGQLVRVAIERLAEHTALRLIHDYPAQFDEQHLAQLQDAFMTIGRTGLPKDGGLTHFPLDLSLDRTSFADLLQRAFTDDGHGDGHLTLQGAKLTSEVMVLGGTTPVRSPISMVLLSASRKDLADKYNQLLDKMQAAADKRPWQRGPDDLALDAELNELRNQSLGQYRYRILLLYMPAIGRAIRAFDDADTNRDATITAIALHRYQLANSQYPESLDALVPAYLPRLPLDPVNGKPLRYLPGPTITLYSIWTDRVDDHGQPAGGAQYQGAQPDPHATGDWVLVPVPPHTENPDLQNSSED